ncbi:DNA-binding LytR/AlgR family response regulator [Aquimarina sp. EL_43]|uniref:LytR/AlgR family response regulator transcription factor n=1 Tax=Aquimarina TaxID=290174 RepID=UPI0004B546D1|nr:MULTISPECIES: LytTR family DNA-binding domain-containing protein [Aquimarina]MBG6128965.1 DNA-binding LytR/AlgR family response regulator [Aquimarina sp. EL_35]MBG6150029.1 DNA-binding LytR/AlgR family response regulator [Aquimarina sp. EL_32]MBG6167284.1 DNA-binding LytR/AlgR family response regulator [Aquimarina sp. EL_43]
MINCLIIEDEHGAQEVLQNYIDRTPFVNCLGIYESGLDIKFEELKKVDFMFLDIQLPELNGLSFLKTLINPPKVIVTTAYPDYAVDAFEENVLDYLVKPFSYERFFKAITRARNQIQITNNETEKQLFLYADKTIYKIIISDILYLKAEVDYVKVVTQEKSILLLDSLHNWEKKLYDHNFVRTHRSYIVNFEKIEKVSGNLVYIADEKIPIGKTYKEEFLKKMKYIK